ncbi:MAG TPA: SDR family oxidoreductase [Thermomicrobiales bacterium]|nr:SDR family oxidoreductase [Thermomicrobiales bacterium]
MTDANTMRDPRERGPKPPFQKQDQPYPGSEQKMHPAPDYGEHSYAGSGKLKDRVALITGADSGIGRAVALAFAREGADIAFAYLQENPDADETVRIVEEAGHSAIAYRGDLRDDEFCKRLVERTIEDLGQLDILVNNAGFQSIEKDFTELSEEDWDRAIQTNLDAMFYLSKYALMQMRPGGAIVNTTSIQAFQGSGGLVHYATTKGGIVSFTRALAQNAIQRGVRVNAVAPGPVWTPLIVSTMPAGHYEQFGADSPMGRPAQPAELAPAYVFLASNDSTYITGEVIGVTGGTPI